MIFPTKPIGFPWGKSHIFPGTVKVRLILALGSPKALCRTARGGGSVTWLAWRSIFVNFCLGSFVKTTSRCPWKINHGTIVTTDSGDNSGDNSGTMLMKNGLVLGKSKTGTHRFSLDQSHGEMATWWISWWCHWAKLETGNPDQEILKNGDFTDDQWKKCMYITVYIYTYNQKKVVIANNHGNHGIQLH